MKVYGLQIHSGNDYDYIFLSENLLGLVLEFKNKVCFYRNQKMELKAMEVPTEDEDGTVRGMFLFKDESGSDIKCRAFEYDVFE